MFFDSILSGMRNVTFDDSSTTLRNVSFDPSLSSLLLPPALLSESRLTLLCVALLFAGAAEALWRLWDTPSRRRRRRLLVAAGSLAMALFPWTLTPMHVLSFYLLSLVLGCCVFWPLAWPAGKFYPFVGAHALLGWAIAGVLAVARGAPGDTAWAVLLAPTSAAAMILRAGAGLAGSTGDALLRDFHVWAEGQSGL